MSHFFGEESRFLAALVVAAALPTAVVAETETESVTVAGSFLTSRIDNNNDGLASRYICFRSCC